MPVARRFLADEFTAVHLRIYGISFAISVALLPHNGKTVSAIHS